jgi:hypothetical protein
MERIYHHYGKWEDHKHNFYDNCSGDKKKQLIDRCISTFKDFALFELMCYRVINEWRYSCEHNLSNPSMNKIAYIGQAVMALCFNCPNTVTMESWGFLNEETRLKCNEIAGLYLKKWEDAKNKTK